ncbi:hypothetical protein PT277_05410 [Acetobacteraceae bacterium ESL0709]|nr:hypothetical protein [Acetobacteraceae bacterium ESL0697]MDF7678134.1 hypothetical protein [Acetobacteraceae bacterium ESL0709]
MRHDYWNSERINTLRSLVKSGRRNSDISRILKIPCNVCGGYLSAAISRYAKDERIKRQQISKAENGRLKEKHKHRLAHKSEVACGTLPLRVIPEGINLTEREKEYAQSAEPLPPLHPLTGISKYIPSPEDLYCEDNEL